MSTPIKLGAIEQEHLQELYEAAGVPRDRLPYSPAMAQVCQGFQDRTFRNADEGQVYGAIVKYVRSSRCAVADAAAVPEATEEQARWVELLKSQHPTWRKLQPYSPGFDGARAAFGRDNGAEITPHEFWQVVQLASKRAPGSSGEKSRKPPRVAAAS
jgi:hypothetical protein